MKIGQLAKAAGLSIETIRYYELTGVLPPHGRTESGYRIFESGDLERVEFIKKAKRLGLSLAEIRALLSVQARHQPTCGHVRSFLEAEIAQVDRLRSELEEFRHHLLTRLSEQAGTLEDCRPSDGRICGIIEGAALGEHPKACTTLA